MVLCDFNLPSMNGLEMVEQARAEHFGLPVVMVTAEPVKALVNRGVAAGVCGWLIKPFKPPLVLGAVKALAGPSA